MQCVRLLESVVDGPEDGPSTAFWGVFDVDGPFLGPSTSKTPQNAVDGPKDGPSTALSSDLV